MFDVGWYVHEGWEEECGVCVSVCYEVFVICVCCVVYVYVM